MSLMNKIRNPVPGKKLRIHSEARPAGRPVGRWREYWVDNVHEFDGGEDTIGGRPRNGIAEMRQHMSALYESGGMPEAWDDVNGVFLDPEKVVSARAEEMKFFEKLGVYRRVPRALVKEMNGNIVSTKWLDTNKGDKDNPNYRSRFVAREFNQGRDDTLYASTPPLEALRLIISHASTEDENDK